MPKIQKKIKLADNNNMAEINIDKANLDPKRLAISLLDD